MRKIMARETQRIHRPRVQSPEQEAAEQLILQRFQQEKPSLENLVRRGDIEQVYAMGEYWELCKTIANLRALRELQGLTIDDVAERTGMDADKISNLENGHIDGNRAIAPMSAWSMRTSHNSYAARPPDGPGFRHNDQQRRGRIGPGAQERRHGPHGTE
jgi:Helix-turn-helix domain